MKSILRAVAALTLIAFVSAADAVAAQGGARPTSGACALEPTLSAALQERFGSSAVLTLGDLFEDERELFVEEHKGACPGMVKGSFFGDKQRPATALLLMDIGPNKDILLVMARPALKTWTFLEVARSDKGTTAVISKESPGKYKDTVSGKEVRAGSDVAVLTAVGAWRRAYIWSGRAFEVVQLEE